MRLFPDGIVGAATRRAIAARTRKPAACRMRSAQVRLREVSTASLTLLVSLARELRREAGAVRTCNAHVLLPLARRREDG